MIPIRSSSLCEVAVRPGVHILALFADAETVGPTGPVPDSVGHAEMVLVDRSKMDDDTMLAAVCALEGDAGYLAEAALEIDGFPRLLALVTNVYIHPEWRGHDLGRQMFSMLAEHVGDATMVYLPWPPDMDTSDRTRLFAAARRLEQLWATLGSAAVPGRSGCWWTTPARVAAARAGVRQ